MTTDKQPEKLIHTSLFRFHSVRILPLYATVVGCLCVQPEKVIAVPVSSPPRVLIIDDMVTGGTNSEEALAAQLAIPGCAVDMVTAGQWYGIPGTGTGGPTGYGFDSYRAIILGDPTCGSGTSNYLGALTALNATKVVWTPAVSGNVILEGVDNVFHAGSQVGADKSIKRGIAFAVNDPNNTGLYYALSCYYDYDNPATNATLVPHLTGFGTFMVRNYPNTCFDACHIVATHTVFTNSPPLTDAELSNWGCSTHEGFDVWPPTFVVLAIALTNGAYNASDGSNGVPYILVRGEGVEVISTITLGPPKATNNIGTPHTVCATLATNVFPKVGVPVTFTISSGPNAVTNYTALTDTNGTACFTYTGSGGLGTDYITASYLNNLDLTNFSGTVTKLWKGTCVGVGCGALQCLSAGTWSYNFCITNLGGTPMTALSLFNPPAGVNITPNLIPLSPPLNTLQVTNLAVTITGPASLTNICFKVGAHTTNELDFDCSIPVCVKLPACCNHVITNSLTYVSTVGTTSTYNYSITIQNVTGSPIKFVGFGPEQSCLSFLPPLINLTLPAYGGPSLLLPSQTRTLNLQVQKVAPCPGTNFYLSTFDTNLIACCSTKASLPPPKCVKIVSPYDGSVVLTNTPVLLRALPIVFINPCNFGWVKFYSGETFLGNGVGGPGTGEFDLTVSDLPAGVHRLVAVAELENGEVETSEPVELTVIAPGSNSQPHDHDEFSLSVGVTGNNILLNLPTEAGHEYVVEYSTNLQAGGWTTLQTVPGDGSTVVITDSVTNEASRFYRAVLQP
jgi:hypothetical protein